MATYEMFWDCSRCGTKELLGKTHRQCPNCGAPQDPAMRYFPPPGKEIAVENHIYYGVDRKCPACETPNSSNSHFCRNCAAPLDEAAHVALVTDGREMAKRAAPQRLSSAAPDPPPTPEQLAWERKANGCILAFFLALILAGAFALVFFFWKKEVTATVVQHRWERSIAVEDFRPRQQESWCDSMPADARSVSRRREQRSTRKVADGEDCSTVRVDNGDGTFSTRQDCRTRYRDEPVYDDKCSYVVDRWAELRDVKSGGTGVMPAPYWAEVKLRREGDCIGCERLGNRSERYTLELSREGESLQCDVREDFWSKVADGSQLKLTVRAIGGAPDCSSIQLAR